MPDVVKLVAFFFLITTTAPPAKRTIKRPSAMNHPTGDDVALLAEGMIGVPGLVGKPVLLSGVGRITCGLEGGLPSEGKAA